MEDAVRVVITLGERNKFLNQLLGKDFLNSGGRGGKRLNSDGREMAGQTWAGMVDARESTIKEPADGRKFTSDGAGCLGYQGGMGGRRV